MNNTPVSLAFTCTTGPAEGQPGDNSTLKISDVQKEREWQKDLVALNLDPMLHFQPYMSNVEIQGSKTIVIIIKKLFN